SPSSAMDCATAAGRSETSAPAVAAASRNVWLMRRSPARRASSPNRAKLHTANNSTGSTTKALRAAASRTRSEEHTSELQSRSDLVCRLLLEKKKHNKTS